MKTCLHPPIGILALLLALACKDTPAKSIENAAARKPPAGGVVDSALPIDTLLSRFRAGLPQVTQLQSDHRTVEDLSEAFTVALARRDTSTLRGLAIDRGEFAWLYYPTTRLAQPPYELPPALMWFQLQGNSERGLARVLEERGGRELHVVGVRCAKLVREAENLVHEQCSLRRLQSQTDTVDEVLFGGIIERAGRVKLIGFTNKL